MLNFIAVAVLCHLKVLKKMKSLVTIKIRLLCYFHNLQHSGRSAHWFITQRT